jgi:hypothetical protein
MRTLEDLQGTPEEQAERMSKLDTSREDFMFGIALHASVLSSMLTAFMSANNQEPPDFVKELLGQLEPMMLAMAAGAGIEHAKTGQIKSRILLEETMRIVKTPPIVQ